MAKATQIKHQVIFNIQTEIRGKMMNDLRHYGFVRKLTTNTTKPGALQRAIEGQLGDKWMSALALANKLGCSRESADNALRKMFKSGKVDKRKKPCVDGSRIQYRKLSANDA